MGLDKMIGTQVPLRALDPDADFGQSVPKIPARFASLRLIAETRFLIDPDIQEKYPPSGTTLTRHGAF
ncbi:MAG: hypothetical protein WBG26_11475 [Candidatus Binataceae bacterium]